MHTRREWGCRHRAPPPREVGPDTHLRTGCRQVTSDVQSRCTVAPSRTALAGTSRSTGEILSRVASIDMLVSLSGAPIAVAAIGLLAPRFGFSAITAELAILVLISVPFALCFKIRQNFPQGGAN